ncbi:acetyl-CoA C-acetyltransferase [Nocardioides carbamazepini]|uniref:acetyl-CoA C-acetyltransferase n=1 Tax=Nocardioides carbamazepini TaxID=2854259 RepID=UPI00214A2CB1|nr:acetyl-CoA C-acetyltransferase [Nocardioides carbamazepini]MCR1782454.1 acetyl-CoA C-acetyltransferase [Nocardioides carbamazepini]
MSDRAVIVAAARSPMGRAYKGAFAGTRPEDLGRQVVEAALAQVPELDPHTIDDLVLGCGQPGGEHGSNISRVIAVQLGLDTVPGMTITRYCSASIQALRTAHHAIMAGEGDVFVTGGLELESRHRRGTSDYLPADAQALVGGSWKHHGFDEADERARAREEAGEPWSDPRERGELPYVYMEMGRTAENVAGLRGISRRAQDEFALHSQHKAEAAIAAGFFKTDITPVRNAAGEWISEDESPRAGSTIERLAALQPVFRPAEDGGTVTAGNACPLNDGAASIIVMRESRALELGIRPRARIVAGGVSALSPEIMGLAPVEASRQAMRRAGMSIGDIDLVELNEAFAAQAIPCAADLGVPDDRLNVQGGSIAIGHPFAMTGTRLVTTLLHSLEARDQSTGLATMCVAGGQGMAIVIERV